MPSFRDWSASVREYLNTAPRPWPASLLLPSPLTRSLGVAEWGRFRAWRALFSL